MPAFGFFSRSGSQKPSREPISVEDQAALLDDRQQRSSSSSPRWATGANVPNRAAQACTSVQVDIDLYKGMAQSPYDRTDTSYSTPVGTSYYTKAARSPPQAAGASSQWISHPRSLTAAETPAFMRCPTMCYATCVVLLLLFVLMIVSNLAVFPFTHHATPFLSSLMELLSSAEHLLLSTKPPWTVTGGKPPPPPPPHHFG
jgi:hypothetical protein